MALTKKDVPSYEELVAENARLHSLLAELQSKVPLPEVNYTYKILNTSICSCNSRFDRMFYRSSVISHSERR
jgi:hypothetical protein